MEPIARTPKQIGAALRRVRRARGLTQNALGKKIKLRQATISRLEAGEPATQLQTLCNVLLALDLEVVVRARTKGTAKDIEEIF